MLQCRVALARLAPDTVGESSCTQSAVEPGVQLQGTAALRHGSTAQGRGLHQGQGQGIGKGLLYVSQRCLLPRP